jgi:hypothetical protein
MTRALRMFGSGDEWDWALIVAAVVLFKIFMGWW